MAPLPSRRRITGNIKSFSIYLSTLSIYRRSENALSRYLSLDMVLVAYKMHNEFANCLPLLWITRVL